MRGAYGFEGGVARGVSAAADSVAVDREEHCVVRHVAWTCTGEIGDSWWSCLELVVPFAAEREGLPRPGQGHAAFVASAYCTVSAPPTA